MWFKVTIFHAEHHISLIQSSQQGIYFAYSPLLAAVLLVLCGQTLVSYSQPLFPADHRKRGWLCETSQTSLLHRALLLSVQAESDNALYKEWFGPASLQFFMVSSFSESITLVISPLAAIMAGDDNDKGNSPVRRWSSHFIAKYLYNNISSQHTCETVDFTRVEKQSYLVSTSSYKLSVKAFYSLHVSDSNGVYKNHVRQNGR